MRWLSGIRGTVVMILIWAGGWGVGFGGLIEAFVDPNGELVDIWPAAMGFLGLSGGAVFSGLLAIADRRRSFAEVPWARMITWGVVTGLLLGLLLVAIGLANDIAIDTPTVKPVTPAFMIGVNAALSAVAALGSAVFFRLVAELRPQVTT